MPNVNICLWICCMKDAKPQSPMQTFKLTVGNIANKNIIFIFLTKPCNIYTVPLDFKLDGFV